MVSLAVNCCVVFKLLKVKLFGVTVNAPKGDGVGVGVPPEGAKITSALTQSTAAAVESRRDRALVVFTASGP